MKTFKSLLLVAATSACFVAGVDAASLKVGDAQAMAGTEKNAIKITISDDDLVSYNKVEFQLSISNTFYAQIENVQPASGTGLAYTPTTLNDITTYAFDAGEATLNEGELGTITFKTSVSMDNNVQITPVNVKFYKKEDGSFASPGDSGVKAIAGTIKYERPKSSEAALTGLVPSAGTLSPAFDSTITEYKIQIKDTLNTLRFTATPCAGAQVSGDTVLRDIKMGETTAEITVTAEDGETTNKYKITVVRGEIAEPSAYLKDLLINNVGMTLSPTFDSKNNKYTVQVGKDIDKLDFKYELEDPMANIEIAGNEAFAIGKNIVTITVTSSDEKETQVYEVAVIKEDKDDSAAPTTPENPSDDKDKKNNVWLIVIIAVVILAIITGVTIVLFKKKKSSKKDDETKLPLKRRAGSEKTVEIDTVTERPRHAAIEETPEEKSPAGKDYDDDESITEILKSELYEDDKTQRFDRDEFEDLKHKIYDEEELDQTKEFNFKDFE